MKKGQIIETVSSLNLYSSICANIKVSVREKWIGGIGLMRFWSLLILLLSVVSVRRKLLKTKNVVSIRIQKDATFNSDRKQINLIPNHSEITNNSQRLFFEAFVNNWYFIIFCIFHDLRVTFENIYSYFRGFLIMKTTFSYFPGMFENRAPAKIIFKKNLKYYKILTMYEFVEK